MRLPLNTASSAGLALTRRALLGGAGVVLVGSRLSSLRAEPATEVSAWSVGRHVRVRLIDAGSQGGRRLAGLEIQLDPGYLTYWRSPGEAGLPPTVDFAGSDNLSHATLKFPAPSRFDEAGIEAFGYRDKVVFPIDVVPVDPQRPVALAAALSFAICEKLCLPASASVRLDLAGAGRSPEAGLVRDWQNRVPVPQPVGAPGPAAIESIEAAADGSGARVVARVPPGSSADLFAEAPEPWFLAARRGDAAAPGHAVFNLRIVAGDKTPARTAVTLTLATETSAVETAVQLDLLAPTP